MKQSRHLKMTPEEARHQSWPMMVTTGESMVKSMSKGVSFREAIINVHILIVKRRNYLKGLMMGRSLILFTRAHMTILNLNLVAETLLHKKKG